MAGEQVNPIQSIYGRIERTSTFTSIFFMFMIQSIYGRIESNPAVGQRGNQGRIQSIYGRIERADSVDMLDFQLYDSIDLW